MPDKSVHATYNIAVKIGLYKLGGKGIINISILFIKGYTLAVALAVIA
jgi:hypothetical protein